MSIYDTLADLYRHLVEREGWDEEGAEAFIDGLLHPARETMVAEIQAACKTHGLLLAPRRTGVRWAENVWTAGEVVTVDTLQEVTRWHAMLTTCPR